MLISHTRQIVVATVAALGLAGWAFAQPGGCPEGGGGMMMMHGGPHGAHGPRGGGDPVAQSEKRLAEFKTQLKITPAQESAWQAFANRASQQAQAMKTLMAQQPDTSGTAPERMARHTEQMKTRLADMEAMNKVVKDLYAVLTPEQRTLADQHFDRMHGNHRPHGKGR